MAIMLQTISTVNVAPPQRSGFWQDGLLPSSGPGWMLVHDRLLRTHLLDHLRPEFSASLGRNSRGHLSESWRLQAPMDNHQTPLGATHLAREPELRHIASART